MQNYSILTRVDLNRSGKLHFIDCSVQFYFRLHVHNLCHLVSRVIPELDTELDMTRKRIECIHISKQAVQTIMIMLEFVISDFPNGKELRTAVQQFCTNDVYIQDILQKVKRISKRANASDPIL